MFSHRLNFFFESPRGGSGAEFTICIDKQGCAAECHAKNVADRTSDAHVLALHVGADTNYVTGAGDTKACGIAQGRVAAARRVISERIYAADSIEPTGGVAHERLETGRRTATVSSYGRGPATDRSVCRPISLSLLYVLFSIGAPTLLPHSVHEPS